MLPFVGNNDVIYKTRSIYVSQCSHRTEPWPQATCEKNSVNFGHVVLEIFLHTDAQTHSSQLGLYWIQIEILNPAGTGFINTNLAGAKSAQVICTRRHRTYSENQLFTRHVRDLMKCEICSKQNNTMQTSKKCFEMIKMQFGTDSLQIWQDPKSGQNFGWS